MPRKPERITGLSDHEKHTLQHGLRTAADTFETCARLSRPTHERVAEKFDSQARESRALADRIDAEDEQVEREMEALCGECGAEMLADLASTVNDQHTRNCSRHPINVPLRLTVRFDAPNGLNYLCTFVGHHVGAAANIPCQHCVLQERNARGAHVTTKGGA